MASQRTLPPPPGERPFVGRKTVLEALAAELAATLRGETRFVLLTGPPGIGKTRLSEELETRARREGFTVVRARCSEVPGAPGLWIFRQLARGLRAVSAIDPVAVVGPASPVLTLTDWTEPSRDESDGEPFRLYADVSAWIRAVGDGGPLVLVLDDLHAADPTSGRVLHFLVRDLAGVPLLVLGTAREGALAPTHPLTPVLGELARQGRAIPLPGLTASEVGELASGLTGRPTPDALRAALHARSGGNPLFVRQLVELLAAEAGDPDAAAGRVMGLAPEGMRHVMRQRLGALSDRQRRALVLAAVLGRELPVDLLEALGRRLGIPEAAGLVENLTARNVVQRLEGSPPRLAFTHVLFWEILQAELPAADQRALHRAACDTVCESRDLGDGAWLAAAAHHALAGDHPEALSLVERAGRRALAHHAHSEAAGWFDAALERLGREPESPEAEHRRALLLEQRATARWHAGDLARARHDFEQALEGARRSHDEVLFAKAALGVVGRTDVVLGPEEAEAALLEDALSRIGETPSRQRVDLLTRLATCLYFAADGSEAAARRDELAREAVACAERLGEPGPLAYALSALHHCSQRPGRLRQREPVATRMLAEAERVGDGQKLATAHYAMILDGFEAGDLARVDHHIAAMGRLADRIRRPFYRWQHAFFVAARTLLSGDLGRAEALAAHALELGQQAETPNALPVYAAQLYGVRRAQGRLEELEPMMGEIGAGLPSVPAFAFARAEAGLASGRVEEARAFVRGLAESDLEALPRDFNWPSLVSILARLCVALREERTASWLLPRLEGAAGTCVVLGLGNVWDGAFDLPIGRLATLLGELGRAEAALASAAALHARIGARPHLALTWLAQAELCVRRGKPEESRRLAREARRVFEGLGMKHDAEKALALQAAIPAATSPRPGRPHGELRRVRDGWRVVHGDRSIVVPESRGMHYLAALLARPGEPVHVLELTSLVNAARDASRRGGDLGEVMDARARSEIRDRLRSLEREIEASEKRNDRARALALREELQTTEQHLAGALGLGGRPRRMGDPVERARKSVYNRLRDATARIEQQLPELGRHLRSSVRTGRTCSYQPEHEPHWQVDA